MKKKKGVVDRKRVHNDPAFERTRENNAEFSRASKANGLLRYAFKPGLINKGTPAISGRLTNAMLKILKSDPVNGRGERRVCLGTASLLEGFNFNRDVSLQNVLLARYSITFDQEAVLVTISFPSFLPHSMIETASEANAFIITGMAASLHFEKETWPVAQVQTDVLNISPLSYNNLQLQLPVHDHQPDNTIVVALGIEFIRAMGRSVSLVEKKHNALAVVKVF